MANKHRGEVELVIGEKTYTLRPTFTAMVEFEDKASTTVMQALTDVAEHQKFPFKVAAAAVWSGIGGATKPGVKRPSFEEIGAEIHQHGLFKLMPEIFKYLSGAIATEDDLKAQEEAANAGKATGG